MYIEIRAQVLVGRIRSSTGAVDERNALQFSALAVPSSTWFINTLINGESISFNVKTFGNKESQNVLFPENRVFLRQEAVDATQYEKHFYLLSNEEKLAILRWTMADAEHKGRFSDDTFNLNRLGMEGVNYDLNAALAAGKELTVEQKRVSQNLSSSLSQLPAVSGEYLRVAEYPSVSSLPWGKSIQTGDIVTNFPLLSNSPSYDSNALAFYKITHATSVIPLWHSVASHANELKVLFPRESYFRVTRISIAEPTIEKFPAIRVGVLLEQLSVFPQDSLLKNIYSGKITQITP